MGKVVIYYFSASGNSLYAAKQIGKRLGDAKYIKIAEWLRAPESERGGELAGCDRVGIVFPVYYYDIPRIVRLFLEKWTPPQDAYIFSVATCGAQPGASFQTMERLLRQKGERLSFHASVVTAANYIALYEPKAGEQRLDSAKEDLEGIAGQIEARALVPMSGRPSGRLMKRFSGLLKGRMMDHVERFSTGTSCNGCGVCAKLCPMGSIRMEGGKPKWSGKCEHCMSCIHNCPQSAIEWGTRTKGRKRYRHPSVRVDELLVRQNGKHIDV